MSLESLHLNQNINIQKQVTPKVLKDGAQVLVRIIKDLGGNKYEGSVAGVRVNLLTDKQYKTGEVFKANIFTKDGVLKVVPQKEAEIKNEVTVTKIQSQIINSEAMETVSSPALAQFITSMGMIPDNLSNVILLQMKNLGLKFNSVLMNKIHDIAAKYPGKEKLAVELIMNFLQKGMEFDPDAIADLLLSLDNDTSDSKDYETKNFEKSEKFINPADFKNFFQTLLKNSENPVGILTIGNNLGSKKDINGYGSWIFLPYEIVEGEEKLSSGIFRLLLSKEKKIIKFCIEHNQQENQQFFVLEFDNNKCKSLLVNTSELEKKEDLLLDLQKKFDAAGFAVQVKWEDFDRIQGNGFAEEEFFQVDGEV